MRKIWCFASKTRRNGNPIYGTRIKRSEDDTISWFFYCEEYCEQDDFYQSLHTEHLEEVAT